MDSFILSKIIWIHFRSLKIVNSQDRTRDLYNPILFDLFWFVIFIDQSIFKLKINKKNISELFWNKNVFLVRFELEALPSQFINPKIIIKILKSLFELKDNSKWSDSNPGPSLPFLYFDLKTKTKILLQVTWKPKIRKGNRFSVFQYLWTSQGIVVGH